MQLCGFVLRNLRGQEFLRRIRRLCCQLWCAICRQLFRKTLRKDLFTTNIPS
jgi:hypothetical protein